VPRQPPAPRAVRERAARALRAADGGAGLRAGGLSTGDPFAPWWPEHRAGRQSHDPRHLLPADDVARRRGAARTRPRDLGDLGPERAVRNSRARPSDRDGTGVAMAGDAGGMARDRGGAAWHAWTACVAPASRHGRGACFGAPSRSLAYPGIRPDP